MDNMKNNMEQLTYQDFIKSEGTRSRSKYKVERNKVQKDRRPQAHLKQARVPDTKARLVLNEIKGKDVETARAILLYSPQKSAYLVLKLLDSAVANAENNLGLDKEDLYVEEAVANQGPIMKRIRPRAKGRADRIHKKTSHISIYLNEKK